MRTVYIIILVVSAVAFTADMILRYMEKIKRFGLEKELLDFHGKTIPFEDFIPHNITMIFVFLMTLSLSGLIMDFLLIQWYFSFPCAIIAAMLFNFFIIKVINKGEKITKKTLPKDFDFAGKEAICVDFIAGDGWGKVKLVYNNKDYIYNAVSANETDIDENDKVLIVMENDNMLFVEKNSEIFDVLNEKE